MPNRIYTTQDLSYVTDFASQIKNYAAQMGVSATAVAGAIAKEHSRYNEAQVFNQALDSYGALRMSSHASVAGSVMAANALGLSNVAPSPLEKMAIPALIDMGIANIKITTAIGLLNKYYAEHPNSDPLGLNAYKGNYQNVVAKLNGEASKDSNLTTKFATLMIKEAQDFLLTPKTNAQGQPLNLTQAQWQAMEPAERDGLLVMYFTMGAKRFAEKRDANVAQNGFFDPRLGDGESGGLWTYQNAPALGSALGLSGYGNNTNVNGLDLETDPPASQEPVRRDQSTAATPFYYETTTLAGTTNAGMYTATEVTNTNTGEAQYIIRHNGTGEAVASGDSYVVNANDTITTTSGNTQFTHGLSDGRLRVMQSAVDSGLVVGKEGNDIHFGAGSSFTVNGHTVKVTTPLDAGATQEQTVQGGVLVQLAINEKNADAPSPRSANMGGLNINHNSDCNALGLAHTKAGAQLYPSKPVQLQQAANDAQYLILPVQMG